VKQVRWAGPVALGLMAACAGAPRGAQWAGTMDTLPGGRVVVTNPATGVWDSTTAWRVVEEVRIGAEEGTGPEVLGQIGALAEDAGGRIWALESQDQAIKVFGRDGRFIRTVGRRGGGPGEMMQVAGIAEMPDGRLLMIDPQNSRISAFDSSGAFLGSTPVSGGFIIFPWPGGVDREGNLYNVVPLVGAKDAPFRTALVKYDGAMTPLDTLFPPRWTGPENFFEARSQGGFMRATVPYSPGLQWRLSREGGFWFAHTGSYELFQQTANGDTVRLVTKAFTTVPVTAEEKDSAVAQLVWFTQQGGTVDRGRLPDVKPAIQSLFVSQDGHLWVEPTSAGAADRGRVFEIFDPEGRFLGGLRLPFALAGNALPLIRADRIVAMTQDESGVPYLVRARIIKPEVPETP